MAAAKRKKGLANSYPFPFLRHGPWNASQYKRIIFYIVVFESEVSEPERARILASVLPPFEVSGWSGNRVLRLRTPHDGGASVWEAYSGQTLPEHPEELDFELTKQHIEAFCDDVDKWLMRLHEAHPLGLVVGAATGTDKWHRWSIQHFSDRLLPMFESFFFEAARPHSEETRKVEAQEWGMSASLSDALSGYCDRLDAAHEPPSVEIAQRVFKLLARARGYSLADGDFDYFEGWLQKRLG
jgi:hypothetical protein